MTTINSALLDKAISEGARAYGYASTCWLSEDELLWLAEVGFMNFMDAAGNTPTADMWERYSNKAARMRMERGAA